MSPRRRQTRAVSTPEPRSFANEWIKAWNARDVEAVLANCADDVVFTSPTALRVVPQSGGTIRGRAALHKYWRAALEGDPDLHFQLLAVYAGIETIAVQYRNQLGGVTIEVLTFQDGLVAVGHATHLQQ